MGFNRKATRRVGGPLTLTVILVAAAAVIAGALTGTSPSHPAAEVSGQPARAAQKQPPPPLPAPKTGAPHPIPADPISRGPLAIPLIAGRILVGDAVAAAELPYDHTRFTTTSFYEFTPTTLTTVYTELAAGSFTSHPEQGVLRVIRLDPYGSEASSDYPTRSATGSLTITAVHGRLISLVSSTGTSYRFDLASHAFV